MPASGSAATR
uniref:Uncharacterized protein n=1 Tax=Arundo donax TaxID=35708 RepID=A0A0A9AQH1_ARUDO